MNQDEATPNGQPGQAAPEQSGYIQQAAAALKRRTLQALSPWVRRRLPTAASHSPADVRRSPTLTTGNTRSLLNHVQRTVDRATVWKPNLGALKPAMVERFTRTVANRFQTIQPARVQRQAPAPTSGWAEEMELTLLAGPTSSSLPRSDSQPRVKGPSIFTVGQRIAPLHSAPPTTRRGPRPVAPSRTIARAPLRPKSRLYTQIEEVSAGPRREKPEAGPVQPKGRPEPRREAEPLSPQHPVRRQEAPEMMGPTAGISFQPATVQRKEAEIVQPERQPEPRQEAALSPVQREEVPEVGLRVEHGLGGLADSDQFRREEAPEMALRAEILPVQREKAPEMRPTAGIPFRPTMVQREEAPEAPLQVSDPPILPIRVLKIQREKAPEMRPTAGIPFRPTTVQRKETGPAQPERRPEPRQEAAPSPVQREEAPEMALRVEHGLGGLADSDQSQREEVPEVALRAEILPVQREKAPEMRPTAGIPFRPTMVQREEAPEMTLQASDPPILPIRVLKIQREKAPEMRPTAGIPFRPTTVQRKETGPAQPERQPEPRQEAAPSPVQREEAPEMTLQASDPPILPIRVLKIQREKAPEMRPTVGIPFRPTTIQREEAPEMTLQASDPPILPIRVLKIQRKKAPEMRPTAGIPFRPTTVQREEAGPVQPKRWPEPRREAEPLPVQREKAPEMPLQASDPPILPIRVLKIQREEAPEMALRAEPHETLVRPPEPGQAAEMPVQRQVERDTSPVARLPRTEKPAPETGEPAMGLGKDILARRTLGTGRQLPLSRHPSPISRHLQLQYKKPAGVQRRTSPRVVRMTHRPTIARKFDRGPSRARSRATLPSLYSRGPNVYIGPKSSLTLLRRKATPMARRQPASAQAGFQIPGSPVMPLPGFGKLGSDERMVLPPPPRPASPAAQPRPAQAQAEPAKATPASASPPDQSPLPLARPPAVQPARTEVIQRQPEDSSTSPVSEIASAQDTTVPDVEDEESEVEEIDLPQLAQRIYPLVKRLLAIERERMPG